MARTTPRRGKTTAVTPESLLPAELSASVVLSAADEGFTAVDACREPAVDEDLAELASTNGSNQVAEGNNGGENAAVRRSRRPVKRKEFEAENIETTPKSKRRLKSDDIGYLLTNKRSKLGKPGLNLKKIFSWDVFQMFSPEEQTELAALVPKVDLSDDSSNALHERVFNYNHHLRESIDIFQENLHGGYYDPIEQEIMVEGLVDTQKSYDVWKEEHYEEVWGDQLDQEINDDILSLAKTLSLADLGKEDHLKPDDELHYTRRFGKKGVTVDRVVKVLNTGALLHVKVGKTEWTDIDSPTRLETLILDLDRRVPRKDRPNGNAWKSIRLKRNGKELGKLWNVRNELASMKYNKRN